MLASLPATASESFCLQWYENALIGMYWYWILSSGDSRLIATDILTSAIGASLGVFLFHIQHTFEGAYKVSAIVCASASSCELLFVRVCSNKAEAARTGWPCSAEM